MRQCATFVLVVCFYATAALSQPNQIEPPNAIVFYNGCCMLGLSGGNVIEDPARIGSHDSTGGFRNLGVKVNTPDRPADAEVVGLIYTTKAGFIDLGHLRHCCDLTKYCFDQVTAGLPTVYTVEGHSAGQQPQIEGVATIKQTQRTVEEKIELAQAISYDSAVSYEVQTWFEHAPTYYTDHNSSFSPEDVPSDYLGTIVGAMALRFMDKHGQSSPQDFDRAATASLAELLKSLGAQKGDTTRRMLAAVNHNWFEYADRESYSNDHYLLRRNFCYLPNNRGWVPNVWVALRPNSGDYSTANFRAKRLTGCQGWTKSGASNSRLVDLFYTYSYNGTSQPACFRIPNRNLNDIIDSIVAEATGKSASFPFSRYSDFIKCPVNEGTSVYGPLAGTP